MKLNRKLMLVLALVLSVAMATTGTLAYLTDRDSAVNVFSTGNVVIELVEEKFDQNKENMLLPGTAIDKEPYVKNTGSVDAYVWMQVAAPKGALGKLAPTTTDGEASSTVNKAIMLNDLSSDWQLYGDNNPTSATINGKECDVYTYKYNTALAAKDETSKLFTAVSMSENVDITPEGEVYSVVNGVATKLNYNINEGELPVYVSAYAIQTEGFNTFNDAYDAYNKQWTTTENVNNGLEWGTASFKPSEKLDEEDGVILIKTGSDLKSFRNAVNAGDNYSGKTVKLANDIDLKGEVWTTPIGYNVAEGLGEKQDDNRWFCGTFDGQGYTIKNFSVKNTAEDNNAATGVFGGLESGAVVKNLNIDNAAFEGYHWVGGIAGYVYNNSVVENCHVTNSSVKNTHKNNDACGDKAGMIVGIVIGNETAVGKINACSAEDCSVLAGRDAGQLVGCTDGGTVTNCWAINVTVANNTTCTADSQGSNIQNAIIGRKQGTTRR